MDNPRYAIIIEPLRESEGGGYLATVPDLPGCVSDGATDVEALENAHDAIEAWIEQAEKMGRAIPTPTRQRVHARTPFMADRGDSRPQNRDPFAWLAEGADLPK
jgi:predicted RNase H-like HicB family nuclease